MSDASANPPRGPEDARIRERLERTVGKIELGFRYKGDDPMPIDVHGVVPADGRPFFTLVTSGMSAQPMTMPPQMPDSEKWNRIELCILLAPYWRLNPEALADEQWYWPIRLLKHYARLPHEHQSFLGWGHSLPNGDPATPYVPETLLAASLILPPFAVDGLFEVPGDPPVHIFQIVPITAAELAYKIEHGLNALNDKLDATIGETVFRGVLPSRKSAV